MPHLAERTVTEQSANPTTFERTKSGHGFRFSQLHPRVVLSSVVRVAREMRDTMNGNKW